MKFDPPRLTVGPLSDSVYVVTHGKVEPHPTIPDRTMVTATVKYDVTEQFNALASERAKARVEQVGGDEREADEEREQKCPDLGACHHSCGEVCWRSQTCAPLTGYGDSWPKDCRPLVPKPPSLEGGGGQ